MSFAAEHPSLRSLVESLAILGASYLVARSTTFVFGKLLARATRSGGPLDDRLIAALMRPLTYALFLGGAYAAQSRFPLNVSWARRLDSVLFVAGVLLASFCLEMALDEREAIIFQCLATEQGWLRGRLRALWFPAGGLSRIEGRPCPLSLYWGMV